MACSALFLVLCAIPCAGATGTHQHLITFAMMTSNMAGAIIEKIGTYKPTFGTAMKELFQTHELSAYVARSTNTQFYYDLWFCKTNVNINYDMDFFWAIPESDREWLFVGTYSLLFIFYVVNIGYGGRWIELWMYSNDYKEEEYYGGLTIKLRTWKDKNVVWTMQTMAMGYKTMWKDWYKLYLPWSGVRWTYQTKTMLPDIPTYEPKDSIKKYKMLWRGESEAKTMPEYYADRILKLWTSTPSRM